MRSDSLSTPTPKRYLSGSCALDCAIDKVVKDGVTLNEAEDYSFSLEFDNFSISGITPDFFDQPVKYVGLKSQVEQQRCTAIKYQVKPVVAKENPTNNESLVSRPKEHVATVRGLRNTECSCEDDEDDYIYMQSTTKKDAVGDSLSKTSSQSVTNSSVSEKLVKVVPPNAQAVCNTTSNDSKLTYTAAELQRAVLDMNFNSNYFKKYNKKTPLFSQQILIFYELVFFEKLEIKYAPSKKEESLNSIAFLVVKIHKVKPEHKIDLIIQALASNVAENEKVKVVSDGALQVGFSSDRKPSPTSFNAGFFELLFRTCGFSTAKYQSPQQVSGVTIDKISKRLFKLKKEQESFLFDNLVNYLKVEDASTY